LYERRKKYKDGNMNMSIEPQKPEKAPRMGKKTLAANILLAS
jgi:hypothetical protein